ncbi:MAG: CaiB/BaiF CoA transferase family protein [Candidatus Binataceae bacterium]
MEKRALSGVRVLEMGQYIAGPVAGKMLSDLGAEVVKLEMPPVGDFVRGYTGDVGPAGFSSGYCYWNRGKQSVCIDIKKPEAAKIALDLIRHFDVFIENFTPGVVAKYGFSWEQLKQVNPRLIMCSLSAFGQDGPMARLPGTDAVAQALSGMTHLTGNPGGSPVYTGAYIADNNGGVNAVAAINAALYYREKTGVGQYIDLALFECLFHIHDIPLINHLFTGVNPGPCGPHRDEATPCGIFKASDGFAIVVVLSHQWEGFCKLIGKPEMITDPRYATQDARNKNKLQTVAIIEEWLQTFTTRDEPIKLLQQNHFISAPVLDLPGVINHPQMQARKIMQPMEVPGFGQMTLPKAPFHYSETPVEITPQFSLLGQDNESVLGKYLGYSAQQVAELTTGGMLGEDKLLSARRKSG